MTGGSILGDKTRMERLALEERAFIRPSPSGGALGGVAHRTREALLLCEAAGFGVVIVETVGIGQSEVAVRSLVDFFGVLLQPGAGDELQGLKRGVLELADALIVNKADGEQKALAERTRGEHARALELLRPLSPAWRPRVLDRERAQRGGHRRRSGTRCSPTARALAAAGELERRRRSQARDWMWALVEEGLTQSFRAHPAVAAPHRAPGGGGRGPDHHARRRRPRASGRLRAALSPAGARRSFRRAGRPSTKPACLPKSPRASSAPAEASRWSRSTWPAERSS